MRNIIIVSDHGVRHVNVSGQIQFAAVCLALGFFCWASYSTGSFLAARSALKEQNQTIRSVASARVETSFNAYLPTFTKAGRASGPEAGALARLSDPMYALTALDNSKLFARIAFLESKVNELQNVNHSIIERVRTETSDEIDNLESIIKKTGLNPETLKKQASKAQGGPYIPADIGAAELLSDDISANLTDLRILKRIVENLPLASPVKNAEPQSSFGRRIDPFTGRLAFHSGLDLAAPSGASVHSTADGTVVFAGRNGAYGNVVDIDHGFGVVTRYGHLREIRVKEGDKLAKGDTVGVQGSTGRSTGEHVHYEVRYNDQPLNPRNFLHAGEYVLQN